MNKFYGKIENRVMKMYASGSFHAVLDSMEGKEFELTIKEKKKKRSVGKLNETGNQNGYYWKIIIPILSEYTGYEHDEVNEAIKNKFLRVGGTDDFPKIKSTKHLSTAEFEELMQRIRIWANTELRLNIPSVEDYYSGQII